MKLNARSNLIIIVAIAAAMLSLTTVPGGEFYRISLNGKKVIEQFLTREEKTPSLQINEYSAHDMLTVYYNHCGNIGSNRVVALKDDQSTLKKWIFDDKSGDQMSINLKDMILAADHLSSFQLVYFSKELPKGRILANVELTKATAAKK
jgi:hypothetical protein